ncbi:hypothetical protein ScPMuIL_006324 [Solemya velum]
MGCDGGTIPTRDELVKTKKKPEQKDKSADLAAKWKLCALTQEPLRKPIVACQLGRLYNKESVLEFLIDKSKFECASSFDHLKSLRDVKELNLTENPALKRREAEKGDGYIDMQTADYICPVSGLEMNGKYKFCFLWGCGCMLSERAMKEVKAVVCHKCGKPFQTEDIIIMNGTEEEVDKNWDRLEQRRAQAKLAKKAKKHKSETISQDGATSSKQIKTEELVNGKSEKKDSKVTGLKLDKTKDKLNGSKQGAKTVSNGSSIQKDPTTSSTYKSLFTSSDKAKKQQSAHWVTYNPQYY